MIVFFFITCFFLQIRVINHFNFEDYSLFFQKNILSVNFSHIYIFCLECFKMSFRFMVYGVYNILHGVSKKLLMIFRKE